MNCLGTDRKPCNCQKSRCLKLYCECFASNRLCLECNCHNCKNNIQNLGKRNSTYTKKVENDPNAFNAKLIFQNGEKVHIKGCYCRRSNCQKNYCECFQGKAFCTKHCHCVNCFNVDDDNDSEKTICLMDLVTDKDSDHSYRPIISSSSILTDEVIRSIGLDMVKIAFQNVCSGATESTIELSIINSFMKSMDNLLNLSNIYSSHENLSPINANDLQLTNFLNEITSNDAILEDMIDDNLDSVDILNLI